MIDVLASLPHYIDHLAPVWNALPEHMRGSFITSDQLIPRAVARGVEAESWTGGLGEYALVASYRDLQACGGRKPVILMEHGSGQSYGGDPDPIVARHPAYAGGTGRDEVILFLNPGEHPAQRNADAYPGVPSVAVGCPRLDELLTRESVDHEPTIAITFHANIEVCPETMSAWPWWKDHLLEPLLDTGARIIGTGHPSALQGELTGWYEKAGIIVVPEWEQVIDEADFLVGDNTSALYDWAALDRQMLVLDAPWYRTDVEHGLRFWHDVPGAQVLNHDDLAPALAEAVKDPTGLQRKGRKAAHAAYAYRDGMATARALEAILDVVDPATVAL